MPYRHLQNPARRALATFSAPFPVTFLLGHDAQATKAFLPVTPGAKPFPTSGPSVLLPLSEMLNCPPYSSPHDSQGLSLNIPTSLTHPLRPGHPVRLSHRTCTSSPFITIAIIWLVA